METILIGQDQERHFDNLRGRCVAKLPPLIYAPPSEGYVRDTSTEPLISETDKARVYLLGHFNQHQDSTSHLHETCGGNVTSNTSNIERNVDEQWQHQSVAGGIPESMHLKFVRLQRRNTTARFGCSMCEKRFFYKCHLRIHEKV